MNCPFCSREMVHGTFKFSGTLMPKWVGDNDPPSFFGGNIVKGLRKNNSQYETSGFLCNACGKLLIDAKV